MTSHCSAVKETKSFCVKLLRLRGVCLLKRLLPQVNTLLSYIPVTKPALELNKT